MKVRQVGVSGADKASAAVFFEAVCSFYDLSNAVALDMFARTGELTVTNYHEHVGEIHLWELGPEHAKALGEFQPEEVHIGCSYRQAESCHTKFDFVVVDSPQGAHHDYKGCVHYEHFDLIRYVVPPMLKDEAIVVLYVNKRPYNKDVLGEHGYDLYEEYDYDAWMDARRAFYGASDIAEEDAIRAYRTVLGAAGFAVSGMVITPCYSDVPGYPPYAFRLALRVVRTIA